MRLIIITTQNNLYITYCNRLFISIVYPARIRRTNNSFLIHIDRFLLIFHFGTGKSSQTYNWSHHNICRLLTQRNGISSYILTIPLITFKLRKRQTFNIAATNDGITPDNLLHGLLRCNPWSTCQCKAVTDMHPQPKSQPLCLFHAMIYHFPKLRGKLLGLSFILRSLTYAFNRHEISTA